MLPDDHWVRWHEAYGDPESALNRRLAVVSRRLSEALDKAPHGPLTLLSMCAGQGRDVIGVLGEHSRRSDVTARLVELDPTLVQEGRRLAEAHGVEVDMVAGDASLTDAYAGIVPVDVALVCGVFGNLSDEDVRATIVELRHLCRPAATVIWTRHRRPPDRTGDIRRWFEEEGFPEVSFDTAGDVAFGVGTNLVEGPAERWRPGRRMFVFQGDGSAAHF